MIEALLFYPSPVCRIFDFDLNAGVGEGLLAANDVAGTNHTLDNNAFNNLALVIAP
jgi:hypothetical protein